MKSGIQMKLQKLLVCWFIILVSYVPSSVSGRLTDELITEASKKTNFDRPGRKSGILKQELDMILTQDQYSALYESSSDLSATPDIRPKRKALKEITKRWTNNVIPYKIVFKHVPAFFKWVLKEAMDEWQNYTCLSFREATEMDVNYVRIYDRGGCSSSVGMIGGHQKLNLRSGCWNKGMILHELGHTVGFWHEHNRPDRDDYVTVDNSIIPPSERWSYRKLPWETIDTYGVPYDYTSIMHYQSWNSNGGSKIGMATKDPKYQKVIGRTTRLSFFDIKLANLMYNCGSRCENVQCPVPGFVGKDCKCWCPGVPVQPCVV